MNEYCSGIIGWSASGFFLTCITTKHTLLVYDIKDGYILKKASSNFNLEMTNYKLLLVKSHPSDEKYRLFSIFDGYRLYLLSFCKISAEFRLTILPYHVITSKLVTSHWPLEYPRRYFCFELNKKFLTDEESD